MARSRTPWWAAFALVLALPAAVETRANDAHETDRGERSRLVLDEDARRRDAKLLRLRGRDADPLATDAQLPDPLPELSALRHRALPQGVTPAGGADAECWIVQFDGRAPAFRSALEESGAQILSWIPNAAWLVRVRHRDVVRVLAVPGLRWAGPYSATHAVPSDLAAMAAAPPEAVSLDLDVRGRVELDVTFFTGADVEALGAWIEGLAGVDVLISSRRALAARIGVEPSRLRETIVAIAGVRDVEAMLPSPPPAPLNDQATWGLQTGIDTPGAADYTISARLFSLGIAGQGLIAAIPDTGLENDQCQFRYGPDVAEACWPMGPDCLQPVPLEESGLGGAGAPPIRSRERKVVAYYLAEGATAYDSGVDVSGNPTWHGTQVAGCIAGDDSHVLAGRPLVRDLGVGQNVRADRPTGEWAVGESLRPDLQPRVDDPSLAEPAFPPDHGGRVQHHERRDGVAPAAQLVIQDFGNQDGLAGTFLPHLFLDQAHDTGATVFNVSFGGSPCDPATCYRADAGAADEASWLRRDLVVVAAAGHHKANLLATISSGFAQGRSVIVVGATESPNDPSAAPATRPGEDVVVFSSRGPRAGFALAPDLVAPGKVRTTEALVLQPEDGSGSGDGGCGAVDPLVPIAQGTSFSAATMSGTVLLVQQYFRDGWHPTGMPVAADAFRPTNALVRAVLVNAARNLLGSATGDTVTTRKERPSQGQGWGSPRLDDTLFFAGDPLVGVDPRGDTQRARLLVLTDTPNGHAGGPGTSLSREPGGRMRSDIVQSYRTAITDGAVHEFFVEVRRTDFDGDGSDDDAGNELRFTLAYSDQPGLLGGSPVTNDLDLEVVSPSCRVYRPSPAAAWASGYTLLSPDPRVQEPPFVDFPDRDALNPVENVFVAPADAEPGTWNIRVIGYDVPGGRTSLGRPNFVDGERLPLVRDMDGDTVPESEAVDVVVGAHQGYALVASGNFALVAGCAPLTCGDVLASPARPCEGEPLTLELIVPGCPGRVAVEWDLDGDTAPDASGSPVVLMLPAGTWPVTAVASDSCEPPARCSVTQVVEVVPSAVEEVSDVRGGDAPLLVDPDAVRITVEDVAGATAYNAYSDRIGSWHAPSPTTGTACAIDDWTSNGDGTITFSFAIPVNAWLDVTASTPCGEGPPGRNSFGVLRDTFGAWQACGPAP